MPQPQPLIIVWSQECTVPLTSHDGVDGVRENDDEVVGVSVEERNCSSRVVGGVVHGYSHNCQ